MPQTPASPDGPGASFDALAEAFDRRRGLPPGIAGEVARAVLALLPKGTAGGCLLELGAGTGEIGHHLAAGPVPYLGLDRSMGMLRRFVRRLPVAPAGRLVVADLDRTWPLATSSVDLVFASRTAHRLSPDTSVREVWRTARPGARLVLGRIRRPADSPGAVLRRRLREGMAEESFPGRDARAARQDLLDRLAARGALASPPRTATRWQSRETPAQTLAKWREKIRGEAPELAGRPVPGPHAAALLDRLEEWARERFGDLDAPHGVETTYELTVLDLVP